MQASIHILTENNFTGHGRFEKYEAVLLLDSRQQYEVTGKFSTQKTSGNFHMEMNGLRTQLFN